MYTPQLLDHFEHPRNAVDIENPDASAQIENPACGDILKLSVKIAEGRIEEIAFRAKGCVPTVACGSALTQLVKGKTIVEARAIRRENVVEAVGGLPQASEHASYLAMDTLKAVLKKFTS
jgi:NifU-like protein involved in Fe-S cluster formation